MAPENKQQDIHPEIATENLHLLEEDYKAIAERGELFPGELDTLSSMIHGLRVELGIEVELTPEQREAYSKQLMDPRTSDRDVAKIAEIARRASPPSIQP